MSKHIYNVTTKVAEEVHADWLHWMQEEHIPAMIATGCFTHAVVLRLKEVDDSEGPTFAVQYYTNSKEEYSRYLNEFSHELRAVTISCWGNQIISFRTLMEIVN